MIKTVELLQMILIRTIDMSLYSVLNGLVYITLTITGLQNDNIAGFYLFLKHCNISRRKGLSTKKKK